MSIEALLSEVRGPVAVRPYLKAAEFALLKETRPLSDVQPGTSGAKEACSHGKKDKVQHAIDDAKKILKGAHGQQHKGESGEIEELRKEIEALKIGNANLHKEIEELRNLVLKTVPSAHQPFLRIGNSVLVLGDGNLSFSLALARLLPNLRITATVLETEEQFYVTYPSGIDYVKELRRMTPNVEVVFGVDATDLPQEWKGKYSDILMNFPHHGGKTNLRKSRELMRKIFSCVSSLIFGSATRFHLALCRKQSGINFADVKACRVFSRFEPKHEKDSWQIAYLAADVDLMIQNVDVFPTFIFDGYVSSGYGSRDERFYNDNCPMKLVFVPNPLISSFHDLPLRSCPYLYHLYRPFYRHDVSIVFSGDGDTIDNQLLFIDTVSELGRPGILHVSEVIELACVSPKNGLPNRIYRLFWQPFVLAVGKRKGNAFQDEFRAELVRVFAERRLPFVLT